MLYHDTSITFRALHLPSVLRVTCWLLRCLIDLLSFRITLPKLFGSSVLAHRFIGVTVAFRTVNTAVAPAMSSEDSRYHDRRSRRPNIGGQWSLMYTSWDYLLNPDFIAVNQDDAISYNGGPFYGNASFVDDEIYGGPAIILTFSSYFPTNPVQRYIFRPILGTHNWLHRPPERREYTCILMPLIDHPDQQPSDGSSDEEFW